MYAVTESIETLGQRYQQALDDYAKAGYRVADADSVARALHAIAVFHAEHGRMAQAAQYAELAEQYTY